MGSDAKALAERQATARLMDLPEFVSARTVLAYHALPDELSTAQLLAAIGDKELYLPRVNGDDLEIVAYNPNSLTCGAYGIQEPIGEKTVGIENIDAVIVPAMAYDRTGNRLGRGRGYYDRLLAGARCRKIGFVYDCQIVDCVPSERFDVAVDVIVTDKQIIRY
ncbi:MAG: 5-formyltetrahydrofolate cyclo-ligase [Bacteroidales bacterium]|nr:5-formyltetrahydrofolate cyclo-ligase [Bacteroidales bacterium]